MPSRKSDARRSDVSVARFVLADEDSAMVTDSPAPEPPAAAPVAEPSASSSTPAPQEQQQQPGDKKDKEKEKERDREREREKERDALTIEVCTSRTHRQTARKTNMASPR
jgi:DNA polymerase epsilon subunit 3